MMGLVFQLFARDNIDRLRNVDKRCVGLCRCYRIGSHISVACTGYDDGLAVVILDYFICANRG